MNIIEHIRKEAVTKLFNMNTFNKSWQTWGGQIRNQLGSPITDSTMLALGDNLEQIFRGTSATGRSQSSLSGGGAAWEGLVCWYLNFCLIGSRAVVIKQDRKLIPDPIKDAFTVNYGNIPSNTESDLVGLVFPDTNDYLVDISQLGNQLQGQQIVKMRNGKLINYKQVINFLTDRDFNSIDAFIIQCKTNWNDNAQIPMLWDMIYHSRAFVNNTISVGANNHQITALNRFAYAFVTVPSNTRSVYRPNNMAVKRVANLSGGNYWGKPTVHGVASSLQDFFTRNCNTASNLGIRTTLRSSIPLLQQHYGYFGL